MFEFPSAFKLTDQKCFLGLSAYFDVSKLIKKSTNQNVKRKE